ncbi:MAG TPA: phospholipid carrier-dependent glycosyltransferase [Ignavibacteriaceae bacterium]|nr:phospholipid carrier-dependent glycosyltransferase [Ignavibacteriaceae bacterium]
MNRNIFSALFGLYLIIAAAIQVFIYASGHYSISSDESARTLAAYRWYSTKIIPIEVWLPMHSIILGYSLEIKKDLIASPRAVSLLFGILSIAALALLTNSLFKNKIITLTAALLNIFLPERIILTAVPLPEIIFIFFILSGSVFFIQVD